jgi:hypothetical protein
MAEINVIKFSSDLQKQLFPENSFYKKSKVDSDIAIDATAVHLPIAGDVGEAHSGAPVSLPLQVQLKSDESKSYNVGLLYTDPVMITRESEIVTNYGKWNETIMQLAGSLNTKAADVIANIWGPTAAARFVKTTGGNRTTSLVGATGTRKRIILADMVGVLTALRKQNLNIPGGFYGLITPDQHEDLLLIAEFVNYDKTGNTTKLEKGYIGNILGIEIMVRWNETLGSIGLHYTNASTPVKKDNGVVAVTDCAAALFWHEAFVRHAEGNAHTSIDRDKPEYLGGSIMSSTVRFGGMINRTDEKGVVALVEATGT